MSFYGKFELPITITIFYSSLLPTTTVYPLLIFLFNTIYCTDAQTADF